MVSGSAPAPIDQQQLVTPLRPLQLERELASHPDKGFVSQLLHNIRHGCSIGYEGPHFPQVARHLPSARTHPHIITDALAKECLAGRMAGPYATPPLPNLRCSGLGVVPKKDGGWRTICDLSSPPGNSINDFIDPHRYSLRYCTIDTATAILNTLGAGALMGKLDLKNAFRIMPVRREDWHLLAIHWEGRWYLDKCLPFGLRSSPALFNQLAEALVWILRTNYGIPHIIHYLDDFFTAGPPHTAVCGENMRLMMQVCARINAPVKQEKTEGPATTITFLGVQLDSLAMTASITTERKEELCQSLHTISRSRTCTKRALLSLIGKLAFACKVVPPGRIFLRRLIDLSTSVTRLHHHVTLNREAMADLYWWLDFLPSWPGTSLLLQSHWSLAPDMQLATDASDLGYGGYWAGQWFSQAWPPNLREHSIAWREMYAVLVACTTWGREWQRKRLLFHCDNAAVVDIWRKGTCRCPHIMSLVRALYFCAASNNYHLSITHIPGARNQIADHLSRLSIQAFRLAAPTANPLPTPIITPVLPTTASQHDSLSCRP